MTHAERQAYLKKSGLAELFGVADLLLEVGEETPEDQIFENLLREDLESVLNNLSPRERDVLRLRYGLDDGRMKTIQEISKILDLSSVRIRQIEAKALQKLGYPNHKSILKEHIH